MNKFKNYLKTHFYSLFFFLSISKYTCCNIKYIIAGYAFAFSKIKKNKIVFSSFDGKQYNSQPKCISDWIINNSNAYDIVWILPDDIPHSSNVRIVNPGSIKSIYELCTASVWVDNCRKPFWIKKKKGQMYIQTWHGPVCLKAVERDAEDYLYPYYIYNAKLDSKKADYFVAECEWRKNNIKNSFWYCGKIIEGFFTKLGVEESIKTNDDVRCFFGMDKDVKILLYLPTFRNDCSLDAYLTNFDSVISALETRFESKWKVIMRLHPNVSEQSSDIKYSDKLINGTDYSNVNELISSSDLIMTDYSGCLFEAMKARKKTIIYAYDYEDYKHNERGFYFDLSKLPSPLAVNEKELIDSILNYDCDTYEIKRDEFISSLGYYENDAGESCGKIIIDHMERVL